MLKKMVYILVTVLLLGACGNKKSLVLYTWSDMFPQEVLDGFEKDEGIKLKYVIFDTNETMLAKIKADKKGSYDLVIADDYIIEAVIGEGLARKIDRSLLSNYGNINPVYQKQFYDPVDEYTVPYGAGVQTIVYDPTVGLSIRGYFDLWNPVLKQKVGIIGNHRVINGMALKVLRESYNTNDLKVIGYAGELLKILAPNIRMIRDDKLDDELVSGEVSVAVMYTSQVTMAKMARPELKVVFPNEGIGFGIMAAFIPSKARNAAAAHAFLDYILDPQRGAQCFMTLGYYSTFSASDPYIDEEYRDFLTLPEDFKDFDSMEMIQNISPEAEEMHNRIWTEFKTATGQ
ncbi:MAG: spermidine/putrescine ABC transporter substrate-binding protein [Treponema sp.]|nr:spermidine/putrescine ABC transporter substrate-binding protein [Treponema sp.]